MRHLSQADYTRQPWKNGKGVTVELTRAERDGAILYRLSMATVAEDGPFSLFPGIDRNLTVISGPGFRLSGDGIALDCQPFVPVAFPGDVAVVASGTAAGPSEDFNVMTSRNLPRPDVRLLREGQGAASGGRLALFALDALTVAGRTLAQHDLILTDAPLPPISGGPALLVRLHGVSD
ncbi:HutD family protein [Fuscovulum ytuae]|uniref:HutD family protein n=1 Tax=Fuscovulum ytuae TaxID=3042299 RepID=A0ABY8Q3B9_9RHOB|nr:HutD family protein [Fuscovulum sp. YMD61]WGV15344.1 HutD family protein [Fuscovulum sp. YMD61]